MLMLHVASYATVPTPGCCSSGVQGSSATPPHPSLEREVPDMLTVHTRCDYGAAPCSFPFFLLSAPTNPCSNNGEWRIPRQPEHNNSSIAQNHNQPVFPVGIFAVNIPRYDVVIQVIMHGQHFVNTFQQSVWESEPAIGRRILAEHLPSSVAFTLTSHPVPCNLQ